MSRPPTPSPDMPTRSQWRFQETGYPSEWVEDYRPGGFQPVCFDDEFGQGRYRVIRKLGYGSFSTVWLAHDKQTSSFVALKIMKAKASLRSDKEKSICLFLKEKAKDDPLSEHVVHLVDTFQHSGPNGVHTCLVFEPMGPSSASMVEALPSNQSLPYGERPRYPTTVAKVILKHALSGIAFLHKHGVVHGDIHPGNMLFKCADLTTFGEDQLRQPADAISPPLRRLDGKTDLWAPEYIALGQSLVKCVDFERLMAVKLSDLGSAFWSTDPPPTTVTPVALRSPELILQEPFDCSIDIWAFGCLIYEFLTGLPLFSVFLIGDDEKDEADDDHINDLIDVIGPLPDHLMLKWPRKDLWIGPHGERLQPRESYDGGADEGKDNDGDGHEYEEDEYEEDDVKQKGVVDERDEDDDLRGDRPQNADEGQTTVPAVPCIEDSQGPFINDSLETLFDKYKPKDIDDEEAKVITALIRQILQYDPLLRPTAKELLQHTWFQT